LKQDTISKLRQDAEDRYIEADSRLERNNSREKSTEKRAFKTIFEEHKRSLTRASKVEPSPRFSVEKVETQQNHLMSLRSKIKEQYLAAK